MLHSSPMKVLGIETTCDETACGIVEDGKQILAATVASQTAVHQPYGGVYPELACRKHCEAIIPIVNEALRQANLTKEDIDLIAVAHTPGLVGALLLGLATAKGLAIAWNRPFVGVNHVEAHLYAAIMGMDEPLFPALGVVVSGGHTFLVKIEAINHYIPIGTTVDDAMGEAFDKVAVLLGLPYPGGPEIEKLARNGDPKKYPFKAGVVKGRPWDFSFSGLKTNVLYTVRGQNGDKKGPPLLPDSERRHVAASFQETALNDLVRKIQKAGEAFGCKMVFLGGGVTQNGRLRELLKGSSLPVVFPPPGLCLDNGVMIAGLGYHIFQQKGCQGDPLDLEAIPRSTLFKT